MQRKENNSDKRPDTQHDVGLLVQTARHPRNEQQRDKTEGQNGSQDSEETQRRPWLRLKAL
jgi:hypothetical protein